MLTNGARRRSSASPTRPSGRPSATSAPWTSSSTASPGRNKTPTGLYFYQARYYNPVLGRFLQPGRDRTPIPVSPRVSTGTAMSRTTLPRWWTRAGMASGITRRIWPRSRPRPSSSPDHHGYMVPPSRYQHGGGPGRRGLESGDEAPRWGAGRSRHRGNGWRGGLGRRDVHIPRCAWRLA